MMKNSNERPLAYHSAHTIAREDLSTIAGGSNSTTNFTTKVTVDIHGSWDIDGDVTWD